MGITTNETSASAGELQVIPDLPGGILSQPVIDTGLRAVIDRLPEAVLIADDERQYVYANKAAEELLGLPASEIVRRKIEHFVGPELRPNVPAAWEAFRRDGLQSGPFQMASSDGTVKDVEFSAVANFRPGLHISFLKDKTAQVRAERERDESERVARLALGAGRMGHWHWDAQSQTFTCSEVVARFWGIDEEPEPNESTHDRYLRMLERIHPDDRPYVRQRLTDTLLYGYECELEFRVAASGAETTWLTVRAQTMFGRDGARCGLLGICWDSTGSKRAERSLRLSEVRFRTLLEQSPLSTQLFAPSGACLLANRACLDFWGVSADTRAGYNILEDPQLAALGLMPAIQRAFQGEPAELPVVAYHPESGRYRGQEIWLRGFIYPVHDDEGELREVVLMQEDVTNNQALEQERARQMQELVRSNSELERFVYVASHDLKEPLRNMMAFSQLLQVQCQAKLDPEDRDYLNYIAGGAQRMNNLIDSLLEYSRASVQRDIVFVASDLNQLLQHALENLRTAITQTGARITASPLPVVRCAPLSIVQLFQNLIGNAIKYAGEKSPEIVIGATQGALTWEFYVRDNGIGIPSQFHDQIFAVFRRLHGREQPGAGIGLAICKAIVEKHGGRIWVESEEGKGATFSFTLAK